jgi:hypothetical protein
MKMHELLGWLLVAFSWAGMYTSVLDVLSRLGLAHFSSLFPSPLGSWLTFTVSTITLFLNLRLVLYVMEGVVTEAKATDLQSK